MEGPYRSGPPRFSLARERLNIEQALCSYWIGGYLIFMEVCERVPGAGCRVPGTGALPSIVVPAPGTRPPEPFGAS